MTPPAARVLAVRPAAAGPPVSQDELFASFYKGLYAEVADAERLFTGTQVRQRRLAWTPETDYAAGYPGMAARIDAWERHALAMGRASVGAALEGVDRDDVGTYVFVSCTGYAGPTPDMVLADEFKLRPDLRRTFVGHMGCYAGFTGLKVALDALAARPGELAMVTCAEVCSVHLRPEATREQVVVNGLFGDAAATILLAAAADGEDGPVVLATHTETHGATASAMTWRMTDDAFRMTLSPYVPLYLSESVGPFVARLLEPYGLRVGDVAHWGIHPGGPKIVDFVGDRLGLPETALRPSLEILRSWGNCSSPTILLILDHILRDVRPAPGEYGVFMAFGPGLTLESALVRF
ncbi:type III polyketide synthase [Microtetraspora fusca]|uniref:Type III polyketide synthase n=1 Tax=Microtetraspora fusca TaxID=1997 RepID=A0ABW6V939_MICFU